MKHGYTCNCGWRLNRTGTRRGYAYEKEAHAKKCLAAANEIRISRGLKALDYNAEKPFSVTA